MKNSQKLFIPDMPLQTHWSSHDLADAVPLRLSELLDFDVSRDINHIQASANAGALMHQRRATGFLYGPEFTLFRIR